MTGEWKTWPADEAVQSSQTIQRKQNVLIQNLFSCKSVCLSNLYSWTWFGLATLAWANQKLLHQHDHAGILDWWLHYCWISDGEEHELPTIVFFVLKILLFHPSLPPILAHMCVFVCLGLCAAACVSPSFFSVPFLSFLSVHYEVAIRAKFLAQYLFLPRKKEAPDTCMVQQPMAGATLQMCERMKTKVCKV